MIIHEFIEYSLCSINCSFLYRTGIQHLLMLFVTWMTALQWCICLRHYLLLMVNVLKSNESITAAGMLCLKLPCLFLGLRLMFFPSALGNCALNNYFCCHYVYSYILPGILAYHKNSIGFSNILHGNLQTCM